MDIVRWFLIAAAVVLFFSASIFVHELGHYWVARRRRLKIEGFSIGFGPKMFSWMFQGVEWSVRWIPAGGFVKLPQMITSEALEGQAGGEVPAAAPFSRILVAVAGPVMNVLFAFALASLLWVVGLPVLVNPSKVGRVDPAAPEYAAGMRDNDLVTAINGMAVKSWQDVFREVALARTNLIHVTVARAGQPAEVLVVAKRNETVGLKWLDLEPSERPIVGSLDPAMPAAAAGLHPNDEFVSFDGIHVLNQQHLSELIAKSEGRECVLAVDRGGQRLTFRMTPVFDAKLKRGRIGVAFANNEHYAVQRPGPTPWEQISSNLDRWLKMINALAHHKETGIGAKDLSGPVGIMGMLTNAVRIDWRLGLSFLVMLNVNLALLNLLPLPVLDGGHIVMAIYELVTRRRLSVRFQEYATTAFAVALISFMLYVTFFDLNRLPLIKVLLQQKSVVEAAAESPASAPAAPAPAR